ncbi:MAG: ABC transporter substrate-binding protein [Proteobacteria bacterium]|nr:ABC transporter substrate-binding protein [Pseudomonadota bacterium]
MAVSRIKALREGLRSMGYADADRMEILDRSSQGDPSRLAGLAADLVKRRVNVIVPVSPAGVRTAKAATTTIPIVANDLESDPVAAGFVASLARPGGNITGVFSDFPDFGTKWLEILKEALPNLSSVVVLRDPATSPMQLDAVSAAARVLKVKLGVIDVSAISELKHAFEVAAERKPDAVIVLASPLFGTEPKLIAELALARRLPTVTLFSEIARAGGLLSYGPDLLETFRQLGTMVGKVLNGQRPADLPVERPTKFEMVVNQQTARALGLTLPNAVLLRADEVIE